MPALWVLGNGCRVSCYIEVFAEMGGLWGLFLGGDERVVEAVSMAYSPIIMVRKVASVNFWE